MELNEIRKNIDSIDDKIADLYAQRMNLVKEVSDYKKQNGSQRCFEQSNQVF